MRLTKASEEVTKRVRYLLDLAHDGNVNEASLASGVPYATLRDLYSGKSTNPSLKTLHALAAAYGLYPGWFIDGSQPFEVRPGGYVALLPSTFGGARSGRAREVVISFAAYPLPRVYHELSVALENLPRHRSRPIIGDSEDQEAAGRLAAFLLTPLLRLEAELGQEQVLTEPSTPGADAGAVTGEWKAYVRRLRSLGQYWERELPELLALIASHGRASR